MSCSYLEQVVQLLDIPIHKPQHLIHFHNRVILPVHQMHAEIRLGVVDGAVAVRVDSYIVHVDD